jgi:hypothetical protein
MKSIFLLCFSLSVVSIQAQAPQKPVEFLYSVPLPKSVTPAKAETNWWHEYLEPQTGTAFLQPLLLAVDNGQIEAYSPEYPFLRKLSEKEIDERLHQKETIYDFDITTETENPVEIISFVTSDDIIAITFHEEWSYDVKAKTFRKNVLGVIPSITVYKDGGAYTMELFYIPFKNSAAIAPAAAHVNGITYNMTVRAIEPGNDAGMSPVYKQRVAREDSMIRHIAATASGKKTALYQPAYPFTQPLATKDFEHRVSIAGQPENLRFFESWSMDLAAGTFTKNVHGVILLRETTPLIASSVPGPVDLAFVPMNGFKPAAVRAKPAAVSEISYNALFLPLPGQLPVASDIARLKTFTASTAALDSVFIRPAYEFYEDPATGDMYESQVDVPIDSSELAGCKFFESWRYDPARRSFSKTVSSVMLLQNFANEAAGPLCTINIPASDSTLARPEFLVAKNILVPLQINHLVASASSEYSNEPGVAALQYRTETESNIVPSVRYPLVQSILNDALSGKLAATDSTGKTLTPAQLRVQINSLKDTAFLRGDFADYTLFGDLVFEETWYFNPATGQLYKQVTAITFAYRPKPADDYPTTPVSLFTVRMK